MKLLYLEQVRDDANVAFNSFYVLLFPLMYQTAYTSSILIPIFNEPKAFIFLADLIWGGVVLI